MSDALTHLDAALVAARATRDGAQRRGDYQSYAAWARIASGIELLRLAVEDVEREQKEPEG